MNNKLDKHIHERVLICAQDIRSRIAHTVQSSPVAMKVVYGRVADKMIYGNIARKINGIQRFLDEKVIEK